ncbi:MAG: hypothetical protein IPM03_21905 [Sulfuritalea sp.]|nr:hypothetical protein [Sulfuritalea sp.]
MPAEIRLDPDGDEAFPQAIQPPLPRRKEGPTARRRAAPGSAGRPSTPWSSALLKSSSMTAGWPEPSTRPWRRHVEHRIDCVAAAQRVRPEIAATSARRKELGIGAARPRPSTQPLRPSADHHRPTVARLAASIAADHGLQARLGAGGAE